MKKKVLFYLLITVLFFGACRKTQMAIKLEGRWLMQTYTKDSIDQTALWNGLFPKYEINFNRNGSFNEYYLFLGAPQTVTGSWTLTNNFGTLTLTDANPNATNKIRYFTVEKLTQDDLTLLNTNKERFVLKKQ